LVNRVGGLSANQTLVRDAIIAAITEPPSSNESAVCSKLVSLVDMQGIATLMAGCYFEQFNERPRCPRVSG
jgi:hypothetical protein